jgi:hypothetical protein
VRRIHRQDDGHMWAVVTQRAGCGVQVRVEVSCTLTTRLALEALVP